MNELADRVEQLTGPDLVTERDIALMVYPEAMPVEGNDAVVSVIVGGVREKMRVPNYTTSLDEVVALMPEGLSFQLYGHPTTAHCDLYKHTLADIVSQSEYATTPALALLAAILRAKAVG